MDGRVFRKTVAAIASISVLGTAAVTTVGTAAAADAPDSGLVAEYIFDQTAGAAVPNTAVGSTFGDASVVRGTDDDWLGTSLRLRGGSKTGTGDYVRLPDDMLTSAESATISVEVKPGSTALSTWNFLWNFGAQDDNTDYFFGSTNQSNSRTSLVGIMNDDSETLVQSGRTLSANQWVNLTTVVDGAAGTASVYINGVLANTGPMPHTPSDIEDQSFSTIGYPAWPDPLYQGEVAAFRVYDRVLSSQEVADVSAQDAGIHSAEFAAQAQAVLDGLALQDITTDDHINLPTSNGQVTWTTSDASVVTADGTVTQPAQGQPNATADLTATVTIRGQQATETITVTVTPSDETPAERLARLSARWVVPSVVASGTELPAAPDGVSIVNPQVTGAEVSLVDGAIVSSASEAVVTTLSATLDDDTSSETVTREFSVTVLPADSSRDVLAYHRTPTSDNVANNGDIARSMHLALSDGSGWSPLFDNYGIFFAKASQTPASGGTTSGILRTLVNPHLFYLEDGSYGVVATRVNRTGGSDGTQASSVLFARSDDLLTYEEVGLIDLGVTNGVNNPAAVYDSASDRYVINWTSGAGASMYTTFASLDPATDQGPVLRGTVPIIGNGVTDTGVANYAGGNAIPVTADVADALEVRFEPIVNTGASNLNDIDLEQGEAFSEADLPEMIDLDYSDGSTADLGITWDAADIAAVDTSVPGQYVVEGTVRQPDYATPFAVERADPTAFKFDYNGETKYIMIATKDLNLDPVNNGGQPTGLPLRMADSIAGLSDEALDAGEVEEVDILSRGTLDAYGDSMWGCFWAPEMHMVGGKLSIYFMPCYSSDIFTGRASIIQLEQDGEGNHLDPTVPENWTEATYVTRANGDPLNTQSGISLDMTYWEDQGTHYYAWQMLGSVYSATFDPADPYTLTSTPRRIVPSVYSWDNTIAEGANVYIKDGTVYLLYSGSLVGNTYATGLSTAPSGADLTDPSVWTKYNYPFHKSEPFEDDWLLGPGHGMWSEDEDGNLLWVFHARTDAGGTGRDMYIHRVHWAADGLPRLNLEREEELMPSLRNVSITVDVNGEPVTDGLQAEYIFDQTSGTAVPNTAPGSTFGDATVERGLDSDWTGTSLIMRGGSKTGSGDYVRLPDNMLTSAESATITTELKASATSLGGFHFLWNFGAQDDNTDYFFGSVNQSNSRTPLVGIMNDDSETLVQSGQTISAGEWVNLTTVIDGDAGTASVYINGMLANTGPMPWTPSDVEDQSFSAIGYAPWPDPLFQGEIASFRVYDRALDGSEVAVIADQDAALNETEIEGYAQALLDGVGDKTLTDRVTVLPDYDGTVTYTSKTPDVVIGADGVTATATQPAVGEPATTGTLTARATVRGATATKDITVTIEPVPAPEDDYGYLMVHFIEDSDGYAEKIYLDISRGNNPEQWDPLNGGQPILASNETTTGVRDPYITYNPQTETYYIIATDLRVFGGDNAGWGGWSTGYYTNVNVWESSDLVNWGNHRQFDVSLDSAGNPDPSAPEMGMMWAPEATWVPDYYGAGDGAFVMYWSSNVDGVHNVMWGATPDFTQDTYEFGGTFIDEGHNTIDTTILQEDGRTYRVTKDNDTGTGLYMEYTDATEWWLPAAEWTLTQDELGAEYAGGDPGGVEGPAMFKAHNEDRWYLYVDVIPTIGYQPLVSTDLDAETPWSLLDSPDFYMADSTKHGGIIGLTKEQYDRLRSADADEAVSDGPVADVEVELGSSNASIEAALPSTAAAELHYDRGVEEFPVEWNLSSVDVNSTGSYVVTGTLQNTLAGNLNQWVGDGGSTAWNAPGKEFYSSTAIHVTATVNVVDTTVPLEFTDVDESLEHYESIMWLASRGITQGWETENGTEFRPFNAITRDAMAAFLHRYAGSPEVTVPAESPFVDADESLEHYEAIVWLAQEGISEGWDTAAGKEFRPFEPITRDAMAAFLYRMADEPAWVDPVNSPFVDITSSNTEFYTEITWLEDTGITTGWQTDEGTKFLPYRSTTRDAMAAFLNRYDNLQN